MCADSPLIANRVLDRCESTNDCARQLGEQGFPHGTWVSAKIQEKGRGRLGREWVSREGNLFLSIVARIEPKNVWTWVPLTAAVGVAKALREREPSLPIKIKWPNDLWLNHAKVGGILCEAVGNKNGSFIIIGLGLNCAHAPSGLDQRTTCLNTAVDEIRPVIIENVLESLRVLSTQGPSAIRSIYESWAVFAPGSQAKLKDGTIVTIDRLGLSGELLVKNQEGEIIPLYAEDVHPIKAWNAKATDQPLSPSE